ncbi:SUKH-3 domain-containing protein [Streptomyces sp. 8N616]|uniref:SUKH-3 domain-containing protein n=1 Tax=Streptomyces sp. 8N616 TaxID=3457414 RepID=UPI003FD1AA2E
MSDELGQRWPTLTDRVLRKAGWYPGRSVPTATWESILRERGGFEFHEAARRFLSEFGGLVTHGWPPGPVTAQSPFRLDPLTAEWDNETFAGLSEAAGTYLCPVGQADSGGSYVGVAANGAVYIGKENVELLANTADKALEKLVESRRTTASVPCLPAGPQPVQSHGSPQEEVADTRQRWSEKTERVLRAHGWYPGRSVPTATWESILQEHDGFEIHEAAQRFLSEFGGVGIPHPEPGKTRAWMVFHLDPLLARWDHEIFEDLGEQAGAYLYPVGMAAQGNQYLGMASNGAVYIGMDSVELLADTSDKALEKLIERIR